MPQCYGTTQNRAAVYSAFFGKKNTMGPTYERPALLKCYSLEEHAIPRCLRPEVILEERAAASIMNKTQVEPRYMRILAKLAQNPASVTEAEKTALALYKEWHPHHRRMCAMAASRLASQARELTAYKREQQAEMQSRIDAFKAKCLREIENAPSIAEKKARRTKLERLARDRRDRMAARKNAAKC